MEPMDNLKAAIRQHWTHLKATGELAVRQREFCRTRILNMARHLFQEQFQEGVDDFERQLDGVVKREIDPMRAANVLLGWNKERHE